MITDNYIEYLQNTLEPEDGYPYQELYDAASEYVLYHELQQAGMYFADPSRLETYEWEMRYSSLRQDTVFYKNISKLDDIRHSMESEDTWRVLLDLHNIPYEFAHFEICYCWMCPGRLFSDDWRLHNVDNVYSVPPFQSVREAVAWHFVDKMYKKITQEHLPMCTVEDFMEKEL